MIDKEVSFMKNKIYSILSFHTGLVVFSILMILVTSPGRTTAVEPPPTQAEQDLNEYINALKDAAIPKPNETLENLSPILEVKPDPSNWEGEIGKGLRKVATFTQGAVYIPGSLIWVTLVPELKEFCTRYEKMGADETQTNRRITQLLGLPPTHKYSHITELWVDPQSLVRPDNNEAQKLVDGLLIQQRQNLNETRDRDLLTNKSPDDDPYPWTGLGYTYDWSYPKTNLQNDAGLTEFVILDTTKIKVIATVKTKTYCQDNPK
jgi:hypothetical protein